MEGKSELITTTRTTVTSKRKLVENDDDDDNVPSESKLVVKRKRSDAKPHGGTFEYGTQARHSHVTYTVKCTINASPKCKVEVTTHYAAIMDSC